MHGGMNVKQIHNLYFITNRHNREDETKNDWISETLQK